MGASAGGLEAFRILLAALPADGGMAYILVQHLDPNHASMIAELLSSNTAMTVVEARQGMRLEPDRVYIIPPGRYLAVLNGAFRLSRPKTDHVRMPFDFLLQSLAAAVGQRAVCAILSGTATDGSIGAKAIKEAGGLVIAQDPKEAQFDGMPLSAIATGAVDLVLPLAKIPEALRTYAGHRYVKADNGEAAAVTEQGSNRIIDLLRKKTAHDFALYKGGTIGRRIARRMAMAGIEDSDRYLQLLIKDPAEIQRLTSDLLINVTRFFRDAIAFDLLAEKIVPFLVRAQPPGRPIRLWVAGCSTGEEAYSIAMLFLEEIAAAERNVQLQIFASDIDADAVALAREGLFPLSIEADVSAARLARFFTRENQRYRVSRELRATIVFSVHDLITDAPFSRLDLISCRNLLIYLRPEAQSKVLSLFHFALRDGGILFLGTSETVGNAIEYFEPISKIQRIYRHIGRIRPGELVIPIGRGDAARSLLLKPPTVAAKPHVSTSDLAQGLLLEAYAPASVLVNRKHQGLYYFGPTDLYLRMPTGMASQDLLASAREGLRPAIWAALKKTSEGPEQVVFVAGRVKRGGDAVAVTVGARRVENDGEKLILLSFVDAPKLEHGAGAPVEPPEVASRIAELEQELDATRKEHENAIRDRETAEEDIRSFNEEAMSVNEEFQTTNEELETSKEELQSLNEELTALNSQLQETLEQNQIVTNDLENILSSADVATLFLDEKLNIRFFTPAVKLLFNMIASDIGRPLADLTRHFSDENFLDDARTVLSKLVPLTREIETANGAWYSCRMLPYRTKDNRIEGVVVSFVDVTARKRAEDAVNEARDSAESANLGKSRFLAAASHDLRQPIQTLTLLQDLLSMELTDSAPLELVTRSQEALMAMSGMLNTLLDINQLESGVIRAEIVEFPIDDLLGRLETEFAYHTQARRLKWRVAPCRLTIRSDPRLLGHMVRNLLSNAVKYTAEGGILLGCRRRGDKLIIEVWDSGLGIPSSQIREIFKEFHQVDNPARELRRGLGLGLAIVQRLGEMLGHVVDVRSRLGSGSVFSIEVPVAPKNKRVAPAAAEPESENVKAKTGCVLVVEDDPGVRNSLTAVLNEEGHQTAAAADGEEATTIVVRDGFKPDMAVVDYNLPGGSTGVQVITRLCEMLGHALPALVLTGDIANQTVDEITRHGYVHRSKPISAEELAQIVQQLLPEATQAPRVTARPQAGAGGQPETVFIVDDDSGVRKVIAAMLEIEGVRVETYATGEAFFASYRPGGNCCLLVDAIMPGMSGLELLRRLKAEGHRLPAIMVTGNGDVGLAVQAMRAGAADFIEKPFSREELLASIRRAMERTPASAEASDQYKAATARIPGLTRREHQVMELVLAGHPNKNIAMDLGVSQRTIEHHRASIMKKAGVKSLTALVRLALAAT